MEKSGMLFMVRDARQVSAKIKAEEKSRMKKRILTLFALCAALILLTAGAQAEGTTVSPVHAGTAEELMEYLTDGASNLIIELDAKDYVIYSTYTNTATGKDEQIGFSVENLNNVTIRGTIDGTNRTRILTPTGVGMFAVVSLINCQNVTLDTISFGHQAESCDSTVLQLSGFTSVKILNCDLWGCGNSGILTYGGSTSIQAENTTIRDCSRFITRLDNCTATFNNCHFLRNGGDSNPGASGATSALRGSPVQVVFNNCDFRNNDCSYKIESGQESKYTFDDNCTEIENTWQLSLGDTVSIDLTSAASLTLDKTTGRATVTGSGPLSWSSVPALISSDIKSLEIGSGITELGYCFNNCSALTSVTLPDTLQEVSFPGCSSLESINIPNSVTTIGSFYGCTSLKEINIPNGVTRIGSFSGCESLTQLNIPDSVKDLGSFNGCTSLKEINIPDGITNLGDFSGCTALTQIHIPDSVTRISSFSGCTSLTEINIPDSVTDIGSFSDCTALTQIHIPDGVTWLPSFSGCTALTAVNIPYGVEQISYRTFYGCTSLTAISIPDSVTEIAGYAFEGCSSLANIELSEGLPVIGQYVFTNCTALTAIHIPSSVTSIGLNAFDGCTSLTKITISDGVTSIAERAFRNCASLSELVIPGSMTSIGYHAFEGCTGLKKLVIAASDVRVYGDAFLDCTGLEELTLPVSLTNGGNSVFGPCKNIRRVTITGLGEMSGSGQYMPWNSTTVPCTAKIEAGVTKISELAFWKCAGLTKIDIPGSVTSIGRSAFNGCTALKEISIPDSVINIGDFAFSNCSALKDIYYGGTEEAWNALINADTLDSSQNINVHYETSASEHTSSTLNQVLTENASLADVKAGLSGINQANLSEAMLESNTLQRISTAEGESAAVQVNTSANLGFAAGDTTITGAKVNFPEVTDVKLKLDTSSDKTISVPPAEKELRFSADLVSANGTELSTAALSVPVAITIPLPDRNVSENSVRVWHHHDGTTSEVPYTRLTKDETGVCLTFILDGFSDIVVTYDFSIFTVSLLGGAPATAGVVDEGNTLAACQTVYAALYDGSGKLTDLVSGKLSGNRITFTKPLTNSYVLFFLDNESAPLQSKTSLA